MGDTNAIRQFFIDVADHMEGKREMCSRDTRIAAGLLRQIAMSKPAPDGGWMVPQTKKITHDMVVKRCIEMEQDSRNSAEEVRKSKKKWEREMVDAYIADADDYAKLGKLIKMKKWKQAFKFWEELDTFVREGIPSEMMAWVADQHLAKIEIKRKKK